MNGTYSASMHTEIHGSIQAKMGGTLDIYYVGQREMPEEVRFPSQKGTYLRACGRASLVQLVQENFVEFE